ncbi:MarR family transcriptional regulator [Kovacikia minuta CCNUW1]|uniref:GbsR/MarR family transcriptional regulator n=1 Tax=Kovacikia minuta TaxID=2931930 RepID=UPI001CCA9658|nr:MarR family transcriptional regulator [Kovacikia minuta]UBF28761.1 MarR family transcriptional regulator [Kovacikia minuta CCNUW1]
MATLTEMGTHGAKPTQTQLEQKSFVEEAGLLFETVGLPRMAGRIFGWLLISNPAHQSPTELAEILQASKGSISTMTRLLLQIGLIERISLPGQRRDYFRIKPNAWSELTKQRMVQITAFRQLAEQGLNLMQSTGSRSLQRLEEMRDIHAFFEQEMPKMIDRWEQQRKNRLEEGKG